MSPDHFEKTKTIGEAIIGFLGLGYGTVDAFLNTTNIFLHVLISAISLAILWKTYNKKNNTKKDE